MQSVNYDAIFSPAYLTFVSILLLYYIFVMWKIFVKAGEPGWAAIIPFYNYYILFKITFGNGWLFLLLLVPIVGFIFAIILYFKLAKAFGKGTGFGFGLLFLSIIFMSILAFDSSEYQGVQN